MFLKNIVQRNCQIIFGKKGRKVSEVTLYANLEMAVFLIFLNSIIYIISENVFTPPLTMKEMIFSHHILVGKSLVLSIYNTSG